MVVVDVAYLFGPNTTGVTLTCKDSHGNTYTAGPQKESPSGVGCAAVFTFVYVSAPGATTLTITCSNTTSAADCLITPTILTGQAASQTGAASVAANGGASASIQKPVTTTVTGSLVFLAAVTGSNVTLTAIPSTTSISTWNDSSIGDTGGTGVSANATGTPGATTFGWSASSSVEFGFAALEILPATGSTVAAADVGGAQDTASIAASFGTTDVGGSKDAVSVSSAGTMRDTGGAVDRVSVGIVQPVSDVGGAKDSVVVAQLPAGASTFIGIFPGDMIPAKTGMPDGALPAGFPGGPSGAGATAPASAGNGWEIRVVSGLDYVTQLAWIPPSMLISFQFARMLDDIGSGTVVLSQDDPWWNAVTLPGGLPAHTLLDEECLWQFYQDGVCRFEFFGETVTEQLVDPSEQRQVTVTGPGTIAVLKWAMIAPPGFPNIVLKTDSIIDSFDEVNVSGQGVIDTNIWTTLSPASHIYITPTQPLFAYPGGSGYSLASLYPSGSLTLVASPQTTFLGASPYDATDTLISAQVTPIGVSSTATDATTPAYYGAGLNGSELTQFYIQSNQDPKNYAMFGLDVSTFYCQLGSDSGAQTKVLPAYDSTKHAYWMITEQGGSGGNPGTFYFWTSPDGQNWTLQWQAVHSWDATNMTFFVTAAYDVDNTESAQITNLNSNVTTPSYQGNIYLGQPMMGIWYDQFAKAQARGTIKMVSTLATFTTDSYGRAWPDIENVQTTNGTDLYSFLQAATSVVNADFVMDPGFVLRVGQPASGQVALGVDRSQFLVLREGYDTMAKTRVRARNQITTLLGGENSDGHEISASSPTFISEWGQREAWFQSAVQIDPTSLAYASAASLAQNETEITSWTFTLTPNLPGRTVFENFDVGDWVGLERPDFSTVDDVRVTGIAVAVDSTGVETHELTLVSYIQWLQEQLTYLANKLGGSFVNTQGATPVAPSKYGTGQVPTYFTPAATLTTLSGAAAGSTQAGSPLVYNPATGQYQNAGTTNPVTGQTMPAVVSGTGGSVAVGDGTVVVSAVSPGPAADGQGAGASGATVTTTPTGATVTDSTGLVRTTIGLQPDGSVTSVDANAPPPAQPDAPTVAGIVQGLAITWDGLLAGTHPLADFAWVQVHLSTVSGFTPSTATQLGILPKAGTLVAGSLTAGNTYYAKLVAVNTSGTTSAATAPVAGTAQGVPGGLINSQIPANLLGNNAGAWALNPNPFFNGGSLFGWSTTNGILGTTQSVPAGAPGAPAYVAQLQATAANCLITGSPAPFPVTPGQPYAVSGWVYNPQATSVTVVIGMNWAGGTVTLSCPAGAWTPLSTVQFAPVGTTSGYQVCGPTASGVTVYITGLIAAGQVNGQLLAANTVTANQIAAGTITANQIAAGTITAAQVAAGTLTAANIQAGSLDASTLSAGAVTATSIAVGALTGQTLSGVTVQGNTIEGADVVLDAGAGNALLVYSNAAGGTLVFTATGSWKCPGGVTAIQVEVWGGGGGGGGTDSVTLTYGGGGGGGGEYAAEPTVAVTAGNTYSFTVGAAGIPGAAGQAGGSGGNTTFTAGAVTVTAHGGGPGQHGTTSGGGQPGAGGIGGSGSTNTVEQPGGNGAGGGVYGGGGGSSGYEGGPGLTASGRYGANLGNGDSGIGGNAAFSTSPQVQSSAQRGNGPGGGGGGGAHSQGSGNISGGAYGAAGQVRITYTGSAPVLAATAAGVSGTDQYANAVPVGLMGTQVTLPNSGSAPAAVAGQAIQYASAGQAKYVAPDGVAYNTGRIMLVSSATPQVINSTSATTITGCSVTPVQAGAYELRAFVQYSGNQAAGLAEFQVGVGAGAPSKSFLGALWGSGTSPGGTGSSSNLGPITSPVLTVGTWECIMEGYARLTATGGFSLQAFCSVATDTWQVLNAVFIIIPIS